MIRFKDTTRKNDIIGVQNLVN